jgi:hypothetical protein
MLPLAAVAYEEFAAATVGATMQVPATTARQAIGASDLDGSDVRSIP